jgi:hypothetical protein
MNRNKALSTVGWLLLAAGILSFVIGMFGMKWDFSKLDAHKYTDRRYAVTDTISSVSVSVGNGSIELRPLDAEHPAPVVFSYDERKNSDYTDIWVENGELKIRQRHKRNIWKIFSFWDSNLKRNKIIAYIDANINKVDLSADAGTAKIYDMTIGELSVDIDAGYAELQNITVNKLNIKIDAGSAKIIGGTVENCKINLNAGSVKLNGMTLSNLDARIEAGRLSGSIAGNKADYTITVQMGLGSSNLQNQTGTSNKRITLNIDIGSVQIDFI